MVPGCLEAWFYGLVYSPWNLSWLVYSPIGPSPQLFNSMFTSMGPYMDHGSFNALYKGPYKPFHCNFPEGFLRIGLWSIRPCMGIITVPLKCLSHFPICLLSMDGPTRCKASYGPYTISYTSAPEQVLCKFFLCLIIWFSGSYIYHQKDIMFLSHQKTWHQFRVFLKTRFTIFFAVI